MEASALRIRAYAEADEPRSLHSGTRPSRTIRRGASRRGFGRELMREAEARLRALGCPKLNLQVRATNREVVAFYERLGYAVEAHTSLGKVLD